MSGGVLREHCVPDKENKLGAKESGIKYFFLLLFFLKNAQTTFHK